MKIDLRKFIERIRGYLPKWVSFQNLIFITVFLAFIFIIVWSESLSLFFSVNRPAAIAQLPTPTILPGTPTPLPEELLRSSDQTDGVILGAIIIILAIVTGSIAILIRDRE
ncbi:MAG: hypothetical protein Q7J07_09710 [Pelolinea sp.]|nr:hypothetical protein [Pelolinea sp.]